jgi:hypothetical protein
VLFLVDRFDEVRLIEALRSSGRSCNRHKSRLNREDGMAESGSAAYAMEELGVDDCVAFSSSLDAVVHFR